jgi:hypothetical protein
MREPQPDDVVIHINDGKLTGWSRVAAPFVELADGPPNPGQWAGRSSYYRIDLKDYCEFPTQQPTKQFIEQNEAALSDELRTDDPKRYPFILYNEGVRRAQGDYLSRCTPKLYALIRNAAYRHPGGGRPRDESARYWAMALGEGGSLWDECQETGIAAVGWDALTDLTQYPDREAILQALVSARAAPGPTPTVTRDADLISFVRDTYFRDLSSKETAVPPYSVDDADRALFLERPLVEAILAALRRKRNVVLQGPPGVGKTFAARHIAYALLGYVDPSRVEMMQFHQSYSYEDFVQGYRPKSEGGFRLKNGIFVEFCNRARIDPTSESRAPEAVRCRTG